MSWYLCPSLPESAIAEAGICVSKGGSNLIGYADHIGSAEFSHGLDELLEVSGCLRTTLLCAEAMWWRCHRAMIADVLRVRGIEVVHILDAKHTVVHPYTSPALIVQGRLSYVPADVDGFPEVTR